MLNYPVGGGPTAMAANAKWYYSLPSTGKTYPEPDIGIRESFDNAFTRIAVWPWYDEMYYGKIQEWIDKMAASGKGGAAPYNAAFAKEFYDRIRQSEQSLISDIDPKYVEAVNSVRKP